MNPGAFRFVLQSGILVVRGKSDLMRDALKKLRQHLLTGVSFAIPFIACGGIMIATAIAFAPADGSCCALATLRNINIGMQMAMIRQTPLTDVASVDRHVVI